MLMIIHTKQEQVNAVTQAMTHIAAKIANTVKKNTIHMALVIDTNAQLNALLATNALGDMMTNKQIAELVYALRLVVDAFEDLSLTDHQAEAIALAMNALRISSKEVHELANEMENEE